MVKADKSDIDLSVIVTAHQEGLIAHKTLLSVQAAREYAENKGYRLEVIVSGDNLDSVTADYLDRSPIEFVLLKQTVGDLSLSRNAAFKRAKGRFIAFFDADDLMSRNWLGATLEILSANPLAEKTVAHSEYNLVFGEELALVKRYPSSSLAKDAILSVYANRWSSAIIAHRDLIAAFPYQPNKGGFGYEDWLFNCQTLAAGVKHILIPETVRFYRLKSTGSLLQGQAQDKALLRANALLSFATIRSLEIPPDWKDQFIGLSASRPQLRNRSIERGKVLLNRFPRTKLAARKAYHLTRKARSSLTLKTGLHPTPQQIPSGQLPRWLVSEWRDMHDIDKQLFPSKAALASITTYDTISPEHIRSGLAYKSLVDSCAHDSYDYVIFVPWLIRGGGDLLAARLANTIKKLRPEWNVMVIGTENNSSPAQDLLEDVEFLNFGAYTRNCQPDEKERVLEQFIENAQVKKLHIINSLLAYTWCHDRKSYLQSNGVQLVVTAFSESKDLDGYTYGYAHTHAPSLYELVTCYTTDNEPVKQMWISEYGFAPGEIQVQLQPVHKPTRPWTGSSKTGTYKVLWASRLSPEKQPLLLADIAKQVGSDITIDMYGEGDPGFDHTGYLAALPHNVRYVRPFKGFEDLPYNEYDAFLYTSLFDGMPNIVLEAGAAGMPLISSKVGGVGTLVRDGKDGLLVERLADPAPYVAQLQKLFSDNEQRIAFGRNLRCRLETMHSWKTYEGSVEALIKRLEKNAHATTS